MDTSNNTSQNNETNTESPNQKTTQVRNFIFCDLKIILKISIFFFYILKPVFTNAYYVGTVVDKITHSGFYNGFDDVFDEDDFS